MHYLLRGAHRGSGSSGAIKGGAGAGVGASGLRSPPPAPKW